jgi:transposase-like protein
MLDNYELKNKVIKPKSLVLLADVTFFGKDYGILLFRSAETKINIYWKEVTTENSEIYKEARKELESSGFVIKAMVLDGKKGVREVFSDIPVQMCHFHQIAILRRYLTLKPKTEAGKELKEIGLSLTKINQEDFLKDMKNWYEKYEKFLNEKTFSLDKNKFFYTHKKLRSAYRSLKTNLPFLFTFQKYPELNIPNTTNSIDGFFSRMKLLLQVHRGLKKERRFKVIQEILGNSSSQKFN